MECWSIFRIWNQVVKVNSGASALEFGTLSSDGVKPNTE